MEGTSVSGDVRAHLIKLSQGLLNLQKSGKFCDVELICSNGSLKAHSAVLVSSCSAFQNQIQHQNMRLSLIEYTIETVQGMLTYLYTGHIGQHPASETASFQALIQHYGLWWLETPTTATESSSPAAVRHSSFSARDVKPEVSDSDAAVLTMLKEHMNEPFVSEDGAVEEEDTVEEEDIVEDNVVKQEQEPNLAGSSSKPTTRTRKRKIFLGEKRETKSAPKAKRTVGTPAKRGRPKKSRTDTRGRQPVDEQVASAVEGTTESQPEPDNAPKPKRKFEFQPRTVQCKYCDETTEDIVQHMETTHAGVKMGRVHSCPAPGCTFRSYQKSTFLYHMMVVHEDTSHGTVEIHKCEQCDYQNCAPWAVRKHMRLVHDKVREFECSVCGKAYSEKRRLEAHHAQHLGTRSKQSRTKIRVCPTCGYRGHNKSDFVFHMMLKHNDTSHGTVEIYTCDLCDFKCCKTWKLEQHVKIIHKRVKEFVCSTCGSAFASKTALRKHTSKHEEKRPKTVCEVCGQAVLDVKAHVTRMHSETKPAGKMYICPVCGRQTRDVSYFRFHMMAKHNDTSYGSVKVYKCDECEYQNHSRYVIRKHKRLVHEKLKDFQCEICGRTVTTKPALIGHRLTHSEEGRTSIQCPHCSFATCWPNVLARHIERKHTESQIRWACTLCPASLKEKDVLRLHLRKKHSMSSAQATAVVKGVKETNRTCQLQPGLQHPGS